MKAEALPKISIMTLKLNLDFEKQTMSRGVVDLLSNRLQDDPEKDVLLLSLKECLAKLAKRNKLPYMAANYLLANILNALVIEGSDISDEITHVTLPDSQADDLTQGEKGVTQGPTTGASGSGSGPGSGSGSGSGPGPSPNSDPNLNPRSDAASNPPNFKKKETCRFYARGKCNRKNDCRFDHPAICKKFRQFGSKSSDPKGCEGKCSAFHPNACRSSLLNRTCSFKDCRFFHLKGTKTMNSDQHNSTDQNNPSNGNWRSNQQPEGQGRNNQSNRSKQNKPRPGFESKNRFASLNQTNNNSTDQNQDANPGATKKGEQVTQEEKLQLSQTLEAIMKRLTAMETRQAAYHLQGLQLHSPVQPLLSPAVPPPGTQTQYQWASQPHWTQSQTQPQY